MVSIKWFSIKWYLNQKMENYVFSILWLNKIFQIPGNLFYPPKKENRNGSIAAIGFSAAQISRSEIEQGRKNRYC